MEMSPIFWPYYMSQNVYFTKYIFIAAVADMSYAIFITVA